MSKSKPEKQSRDAVKSDPNRYNYYFSFSDRANPEEASCQLTCSGSTSLTASEFDALAAKLRKLANHAKAMTARLPKVKAAKKPKYVREERPAHLSPSARRLVSSIRGSASETSGTKTS